MSAARVIAIMPVYNEAPHLPAVLESIQRQKFPRDRLYLVVVDGSSSDGSASIVRTWFAASGVRGCVLDNPRRGIPIALNLGLRCANPNDIVVRLDAHTLYGETYLLDAVEALENAAPDVACVGAAQRPMAGSTFAERLVEALYTNPMGLGGADFRTGDDVRSADSVYLGAWRPGVLSTCGGFNESMEANEDAELAARLRKAGFRVLRIPLACRFIINRGAWGVLRQWNRYGFWRAKMLRLHSDAIRGRHVLICVAALASIALAASPVRIVLVPAFAVYALAILLGRRKGEPLGVTLATLVFFPSLQFAFAAGMLAGLCTNAAPEWPSESDAAATIES